MSARLIVFSYYSPAIHESVAKSCMRVETARALTTTQNVTEREENNRKQPGDNSEQTRHSTVNTTADGPTTRTTDKNSIIVSAQNGHTHGYSADNNRRVVVGGVTATGFSKNSISHRYRNTECALTTILFFSNKY
ncbi:hypothetical protein QTP88_013062 [Uroleucon formosanum]